MTSIRLVSSRSMPLVVLYVGYLLIITLYPFAFAGEPSQLSSRLLTELLTFKEPSVRDFVQNVILFIPFGVLLYCGLKSPQRSRAMVTLYALGTGCALSLAIEIGQLYFVRHPAIADVFSNGLGAGLGAFLASLLPARMGESFARFWDTLATSKALLLCAITFGAIPLILAVIQWPWPNFQTWDTRMPFQIGNEGTGDRPWLGRIYRVALYNRALSPAEVANNFRKGFAGNAMIMHSESGLVALYTFAEGEGDRVRDVSGLGTPMNLSIVPRSHVRWLSSNGIELARPAIITSEGPAIKLVDAFRGRDEISVEAWFVPGNLTQKGPARIVSFSEDTRRHNFTLGQDRAEIVFWLRTLVSGRTGAPQALVTNGQVLSRETLHVVATYSKGIERLYINGAQHPAVLDVTKDVATAFATSKQPLAQIAYSFFYFFPLALFVAMFLASRTNGHRSGLLLPVAAAAGLQALTEIVEALAFDRAVDCPLIGYGLIVGSVGTLFGAGFLKTEPRAPAKSLN